MKPHEGQLILRRGEPLESATAAMIMIHGRGSTAENMLKFANQFKEINLSYLAPQASSRTWYPYNFIRPIPENEPGISSGIMVIHKLVESVEAAGIPREKIVVLGFSQGACLSLEFAARYPCRYGGIVGLSGGLFGPIGTLVNYPGNLLGTPVFLGCSDNDPHIPVQRVRESSTVFQRMGASVTERIYPGANHVINQDEVNYVRTLLLSLTGG